MCPLWCRDEQSITKKAEHFQTIKNDTVGCWGWKEKKKTFTDLAEKSLKERKPDKVPRTKILHW